LFLLKGEIFRGLGTKLSKTSITGMRISQNLDFFFFAINRSQFRLLALSFLFFSALLHWLPFALYVLAGCSEKLDVNYGRSLEMANIMFDFTVS